MLILVLHCGNLGHNLIEFLWYILKQSVSGWCLGDELYLNIWDSPGNILNIGLIWLGMDHCVVVMVKPNDTDPSR